MRFSFHVRRIIPVAALLLVASFFALGAFIRPVDAASGINQQINFQGRLFNHQGAVIPDGYYNMQFKIYQDGDGQTAGNTTGTPAGTLKWTETYLNSTSQGVLVKNGFLSVQLGSVTPFGSSVDWFQDTLWVSLNIGSTNAACSPFINCSPDGEMLPMKRLSAAAYAMNAQYATTAATALNANALNGVPAANFVQLAQTMQVDASNVGSIQINKTGTGNLITLQSSGANAFSVLNNGDISLGANANHSISIATSAADTAGMNLTLSAGNAGVGTSAVAGGNLVLQGGNGGGAGGNGGNVVIDAGAPNGSGTGGTIGIGTTNATAINIGTTNQAGKTTNVTIGSGASNTGGTTAIQAKSNVTVSTNGVVRATFDTLGAMIVGNGTTSTAPANFVIKGTASTASGVTGSNLSIQGGNATTGNTNGGNVTISGGTASGTGASGLVVFNTPTFQTASVQTCVSTPCNIAQASVDGYGAIVVNTSGSGYIVTLPAPSLGAAAYGRIVYVTSASINDFTLSVNGGVGVGNQIAMRNNVTATMIWGPGGWTAAGASSSTTLQSAYDSTLQSAGGAELIVSHTSTTNGLSIRDSYTNPVANTTANGTLLSVQTASAASLFSVNGNVTEYATDAGAEQAGATTNTFPAGTWSGVGNATVSRYTTAGTLIATGQASVEVATTIAAGDGVKNTLKSALTPNMTYNLSFSSRLVSGTFTDLAVYYSTDGTTNAAALISCKTGIAVPTSAWTKVNCSFTAPATDVTAANSIILRQIAGSGRIFYIDNMSVTIAADYNYATDGSVFDQTNFATNWSAVAGSTIVRTTSLGYDASDSAQVNASSIGQGVRNKLAISPLPNTLYRVSVYATSSSLMPGFRVQYSPNAGTTMIDCADYNSQTVPASLTDFTQITCYIKTGATAPTTSYVYFTQTDGTSRTFYVDAFSMTLSTNTVPNVQIGGGANGGPTTLFTLDKGASAPIAANNEALLGSMYYDTTLGKLQCYEADGWGACGSSPDNIVTISPEYTNAVLHGTGIGTMTSDICSGTLQINDGLSGRPNVCGATETYNFYKWTSPQATDQTYAIYVTYQLPSTFKGFNSGQTSLMARTDAGPNSGTSTVRYTIYRNSSTGLIPCGSSTQVSTGTSSSWHTQTASGASDPSTCGFTAGESIVFKIEMIASRNANAYVGNLNFAFSNR